MKKEEWKDEVLNSLQGLKRAAPNDFLFTRIEARLAKQIEKVSPWQLRIATVAFLILLAINTVAILRSNQQKGSNSSEYSLTGFQSY